MRVPVHLVETVRKVAKVRKELEQGGPNAERASPEELAIASGLSLDRVRHALAARVEPVSLETPIGGDGELRIIDRLEDSHAEAPFDAVVSRHRSCEARKLLVILTEREKDVVRMRYGIDGRREHTLAEIGKRMDLTRERIRQIEVRALRRMRLPLGAARLRAELDR